MDTLDGLKTVIAVVEGGSFTAASERLGISKALVSKYVGEVEDKLDVRLFNRTTRQVSLTEAGKRYYSQAQTVLDQYGYMLDDVLGDQKKPRGVLRISSPVSFGEQQLAPLLPKFMQQYPDLNIELIFSNRAVDMLEEGIDIRLKVGNLADSAMVARKIRTIPLVLCTSYDYISKHGKPASVQDLAGHNCIIDSNFSFGKLWPVYTEKGVITNIEVKSTISANSPIATAKLAMAGVGIAMVPDLNIMDEMSKGGLEVILPNSVATSFGLYAIYPHRKYVSMKLKCFIDFMFQEFAD